MAALAKLALALSALMGGNTLQTPACELVDVEAAETLLGAGAQETTGGSVPSMCIYTDEAGRALLTIRVTPEEIYDLAKIQEPHTALDIGEKARFNLGETGVVALQFVDAGFHVSIGLVPNPDRPADIEAFEQVGRTAADRIR